MWWSYPTSQPVHEETWSTIVSRLKLPYTGFVVLFSSRASITERDNMNTHRVDLGYQWFVTNNDTTALLMEKNPASPGIYKALEIMG